MNFIKNNLIIIILLCNSMNCISQISHGGSPLTISHNNAMLDLISETPTKYIPSVSNAFEKNIIKNNPSLNDKNIYGKRIKYNIDILTTSKLILYDDSLKIFTLKVASDSAYGMRFFFSDFQIPEGGKLFLYNESKTHIIGGFTHQNNRENNKFGTRPISGSKIFIEYSEPINANYSANLIIEKVVHIFDDGFFDPDNLAGECNKSVACLEDENFFEWENEAKSVVMILASYENLYDHWGSGVLLNIAGGYSSIDRPYLLTAAHLTHGFDPYSEVEDWVFLFGFEDTECGLTNSNTQYFTQNNSVYGAELITYDDYFGSPNSIKSDFLLCKLMDDFNTINSNIDVSYAGWDRSSEQLSPALCIHHPSSSSKMFSYTETITTANFLWNEPCYSFVSGWDFWGVYWSVGVTEGGSSGSPIFNMSHKVFGHLYGGFSDCEFGVHTDCNVPIGPDKQDAFGKFSTSWSDGDFEYYLDPYSMNLSSVETFTLNYCGNGICEPENGEVFPDCADCPDPSGGGGNGNSNCSWPVGDGFLINGHSDEVVLICSDYNEITLTSPDENCPLNIGRCIRETNLSVCSQPAPIHCRQTGLLWWKECNCWHWSYFLGITECDQNVNPIGEEISSWFYIRQTSSDLLQLPGLNDIISMGVVLEPGKYYKLKLATIPLAIGGEWTESSKYFYILPENAELSGEIGSGNYLVEEDITVIDASIQASQNVIMTAGNSITILPNSIISYGSDYLAKIDPEIALNCATVPTSNPDSKSLKNSINQEPVKVLDARFSKLNRNDEIQIYPNPTNGFVNICFNKKVEDLTIGVCDINGKRAYVEKWEYHDNIILNLSPYPKGIYLLTITTADKVYTEKIVLQ